MYGKTVIFRKLLVLTHKDYNSTGRIMEIPEII